MGKKRSSAPPTDPLAPAIAGAVPGPVDKLLIEFLQHLCRIRNRRWLFGGDRLDIRSHGAGGMCGLLMNEALKFLRERRLDNLPSQQQLAELVGVNAGSFGNFLAGKPSRNPNWVAHTRTGLRHLAERVVLLQDNSATSELPLRNDALPSSSPSTEVQPLIERLDEYFFRDANPRLRTSTPAYFLEGRAQFGEPMSRTELAGEVEWYAVEREVTSRPAKLVWVSGDSPFFRDGATGVVGQAVRRAVDAGVEVRFVYHGRSPAANSLDEFFGYNGLSPTPVLAQIDTANLGALPPSRWWEFTNPALQFLYLRIDTANQTKPDETLYILRAAEEDRREGDGPLALEANTPELAAFKAWLNRMGL